MGVAPRLLPPDPAFRSGAEEAVWKKLRSQLPDGSFLAANVHLHSHEDSYEADLVVGYPDLGFAVIEVKGGRVQHTDEGWVQLTHDGPKPIDPAGQADRGKRLLDSYARARGWSHGPLRFEHLVAFPDVELGPEPPAPDLPRWSLIAKNDLDDAAGRIWDALDKRQTDKPRPSAAWVADLADLLGGRGQAAASLLGVMQAREEHVTRLTEQQFTILRAMRTNPCIRATGGPGSGKTFLALERARMWAEDGLDVLFLAYSVGLTRWLEKAVSDMPAKVSRRITVCTYGSYGVDLGVGVPDGATQDWWDETLPSLMTELVTPRYDALVVDEVQDFADSWWPSLLGSLRSQHLFVAGDERQSVFPGRRGTVPLAMTEMTLDANLRNTRQIADVFNPVAGDRRMRLLGGDGAPVRFVPCAPDEVYDVGQLEVERLLEEGYPEGDVALLTTRHQHPYHKATAQQLGKPGYWEGFWLTDEVFYATVMGFKGLERPAIVLAVDDFHEGVARDVLYAGLSRARDRLVVVGDLQTIRAAAGDEVCKRLSAGG